MAWIESHQEIANHPKTRKLARRLEVSIPTVIGHLHVLWHWALAYAPEGDLSKYECEDIAIAAMWDDDCDRFVEALTTCGWLDQTSDGWELHDWQDFGGKLVEKRRKDAERKRQSRGGPMDTQLSTKDGSADGDGRPADGAGREHHQTRDNKTSPPPDGGDVENPRIDRICVDVAAALGDEFVISDLADPLDVLRMKLRAGEEIKSPVAYTRKLAEKSRATREARERSESPLVMCPACERSVRERDLEAHIAAEHEREAADA